MEQIAAIAQELKYVDIKLNWKLLLIDFQSTLDILDSGSLDPAVLDSELFESFILKS